MDELNTSSASSASACACEGRRWITRRRHGQGAKHTYAYIVVCEDSLVQQALTVVRVRQRRVGRCRIGGKNKRLVEILDGLIMLATMV